MLACPVIMYGDLTISPTVLPIVVIDISAPNPGSLEPRFTRTISAIYNLPFQRVA
ncbi:hypothetical protein TUM17554_11070 [Klebsiella pneumoniae]|nr:hypothetical protein TUM17554_11070 [Klebsiella pneumoniae]GKL65400.1 hypothetical protein NUBL22817_32760 [Klebsiella pneumoniae]